MSKKKTNLANVLKYFYTLHPVDPKYEGPPINFDEIDFNDPVALQQLHLLISFSMNIRIADLLHMWHNYITSMQAHAEKSARILDHTNRELDAMEEADSWKHNEDEDGDNEG